MRHIKRPEDFDLLFPGAVCRLMSSGERADDHYSPHFFTVIDTRAIYTEDGEVPNPVTLVTTDMTGRPHTVTVSAYALITKD